MTSPYTDPNRVNPVPTGRVGDPYSPQVTPTATQEELQKEASYARYQAEDRSLGEIAGDLFDNASTLIKQEVELAKAEAKDSASKAGKGVGMFAGAGVTALLGMIAVTLALWWGIAILIGSDTDPALGWSGVIVALIWFVIAAILALVGKKEFEKMRGLKQTTQTVKKIPNAAAGNEEKNR